MLQIKVLPNDLVAWGWKGTVLNSLYHVEEVVELLGGVTRSSEKTRLVRDPMQRQVDTY